MKHLKNYKESIEDGNKSLLNDMDVVISICSDLTDIGYVSKKGTLSNQKLVDVEPTFVLSIVDEQRGIVNKHMNTEEYQKYINDNFDKEISSVEYRITCELYSSRCKVLFGRIPSNTEVESIISDIKKKVNELCHNCRINNIRWSYNSMTNDTYSKGDFVTKNKIESSVDIYINSFKKNRY